MDKTIIRNEIERRYNCEKQYPNDREACVAAAVLNELLLFIDAIPENNKNTHIKPQEQMEDYKKKYEEALERMKSWANGEHPECFSEAQKAAEFVFPELKKSEDERIRKNIINWLKNIEGQTIPFNDYISAIAWLEKQGKKVDAIENFDTEFEKQVSYFTASAINKEHEYNQEYVKWAANALLNYAKHELEKQNEQKNTDKVEPKFKVGDWVIYECGEDSATLQIKNIVYGTYEFTDNSTLNVMDENTLRLWTIQDAKDGDAISFNDGHGNDCIELIKSITGKKIEFWVCLTNGNCYEVFDGITPYTNFASREDATPATKEQRDLLFQKMKEAGYEWDVEKKELKKIEQNPTKEKQLYRWLLAGKSL